MNCILLQVLKQDGGIAAETEILWELQERKIDVSLYRNPITYASDNGECSIDASERIAILIDLFQNAEDLDEEYGVILDGIQEKVPAEFVLSNSMSLRAQKAKPDARIIVPGDNNLEYVTLADLIKKKRRNQ